MDPLSGLALAAVALLVWAYVTYYVVRIAVRTALREHDRERGKGHPDDPLP